MERIYTHEWGERLNKPCYILAWATRQPWKNLGRMVCANKGRFSEYICEWKKQNEEYIKYVCGLFRINFFVWCEVGSQGFVSILVHTDIQLIQHLLCKWPKLQPLLSGGRICVDLPQDFILSHPSICLSLCKHHNIFITIILRLEIWWREFSNFFLLFLLYCLILVRFFAAPRKTSNQLINFNRKNLVNFDRDSTESIDHLGENSNLNPRTFLHWCKYSLTSVCNVCSCQCRSLDLFPGLKQFLIQW